VLHVERDAMTLATHVRALFEEDGGVLLDIKAGKYFGVNATGVEIIKAMAASTSDADIANALASKYDVTPDDISDYVTTFMAALRGRGWVNE
jgi:hypothetical protein